MSFVLISNNRKPVSGPVSGNDTVLVTALKKKRDLLGRCLRYMANFPKLFRRF